MVLSPLPCRSPHGERGLKWSCPWGWKSVNRRSPHGERGLKYTSAPCPDACLWSLPAWGAWIEILTAKNPLAVVTRRSPHGERGLKSGLSRPFCAVPGVAPRMGSVD